MNALEERVSRVLRDRADGGTDVDRLLSGAQAGGRRNALRRRAMRVTGAAIAVLLAVVGVTAVVMRFRGTPEPTLDRFAPASSAPPVEQRHGRPPAVAGTSALADPAVVGADWRRFHLDVDLASFDGVSAVWVSRDRFETLTITEIPKVTPAPIVMGILTVARDPALLQAQRMDDIGAIARDVVVNGHAGLAVTVVDQWGRHTNIVWSPVPGLWAQARTDGPEAEARALSLAEHLRLDRVYRCAVPYRATWMPPDAKAVGCTYGWSGSERPPYGYIESEIDGGLIRLRRSAPPNPSTFPGEYGRAVRTRQYSRLEMVMRTEECTLILEGVTSVGEENARRVVESMRCVLGDDPMQWPADPFG